MPINMGGPDQVVRKLDCAVLEILHRQRARATDSPPPFQTVRAPFFEGQPLYPGAGFASRNHIQICVRERSCIHGFFWPLDADGERTKFEPSANPG